MSAVAGAEVQPAPVASGSPTASRKASTNGPEKEKEKRYVSSQAMRYCVHKGIIAYGDLATSHVLVVSRRCFPLPRASMLTCLHQI